MTLATIRSHLWRGGSDILLHYRATGAKEIKHASLPQPQSDSDTPAAPGTTAPTVMGEGRSESGAG